MGRFKPVLLCAFSLLAMGLLFGATTAGAQAETVPYTFASGPNRSGYEALGDRLAAGAYEGFALRNLTTRGSMDNLDRLVNGDAQFALTQQDAFTDYLARNGYTQTNSPIKAVGVVTYDYLHILLRVPFRAEETTAFRGTRMWIGRKGSGTSYTSRKFLDVAGIPIDAVSDANGNPLGLDESPADGVDNVARINEDFAYVATLFERKQLDVAMLVSSAGARLIREVWCSGYANFYSVPFDMMRALSINSPIALTEHHTSVGAIPAGAYTCDGTNRQDKSISTIMVPVLLVAHRDVPETRVGQVWLRAKPAWREVERDLGLASTEDITTTRSLVEGKLPVFQSLQPSGLDRTFWIWLASVAGLLLFAGAVVLYTLRRREQIMRLFHRNRFVAIIFIILGIGLSSMMGAYFFEHNVNEHFSNPAESLWSVLIYFFSGMEDRILYTTGGRIFAMIAMMMGPAMIAVVTGYVASALVINFMEEKMPKKLEDHFIILNWNQRAIHIIKQLKNEALHMENTIIVVSDDSSFNFKNLEDMQRNMERREHTSQRLFEDVYFSAGDPTDERTLRNINLEDAYSVLILADERLGEHADERTLRALFTMQHILRGRENKERSVHVVTELVNMDNKRIIDEISENFPGTLDAIAGTYIRTLLLSQALLNEGLVEFYTNLLEVSQESNEVYMREIPASAVGTKFPEYAARVMAHKIDVPLIPVGVLRREGEKQRLYVNPKPDTPGYLLQRGDRLLIMAYESLLDDDLPDA